MGVSLWQLAWVGHCSGLDTGRFVGVADGRGVTAAGVDDAAGAEGWRGGGWHWENLPGTEAKAQGAGWVQSDGGETEAQEEWLLA